MKKYESPSGGADLQHFSPKKIAFIGKATTKNQRITNVFYYPFIQRRTAMKSILQTNTWAINRRGLILVIGLAIISLSSGVAWAKPKTTIYKECGCLCQAPGDVMGVITNIPNTGGYSCGAYNGKTCNYSDPATGGVRTGTTKYCGGFKPGGMISYRAPISGVKGQVLRRGIEGEQSAEGDEKGEMIITVPAE
jgi:hypothetical protein